jgi:hypothetical protein
VGRYVVCLVSMCSDAIKPRKCLWFQEAVVRFPLVRNSPRGA